MEPGCIFRLSCAVISAVALLGCHSAPASGRVTHESYEEAIRGGDVRFGMVWIPEGRFWIGRTEVTWDEYLSYCAFGKDDDVPADADAVTRPSKPLEVTPYDRDWGAGRRPAVGMSRNAAQKYCQWLSLNTGRQYRLPTEAEWQQACGGPPDVPLTDCAWYEETSDGRTEEVGRKKPNRYGVYDMLGNLWEYCLGPYDIAEPEKAVLRGGSWRDPASLVTPESRLAFDYMWVLGDPNVPPGVWWVPDGQHLGFRVLRAQP